MIRLHVGCGDDHLPDHINCDIRADCDPDVVCAADALPFADGSAMSLSAYDLLEHTPYPERFLTEWHRVLKPGGTLTVRTPNLHAIAVQLAYYADKPGPAWGALVTNVYGGHQHGPDGVWDTHHWSWSPRSLAATLDQAGFDVLSNDELLNMTATARRR